MFDDDPINPIDISQLSIEKFDEMLSQLRSRRTMLRERATAAKVIPSSDVSHITREKYAKLVLAVDKKFTKLDADIDKLTEEVNKLRLASVEVG